MSRLFLTTFIAGLFLISCNPKKNGSQRSDLVFLMSPTGAVVIPSGTQKTCKDKATIPNTASAIPEWFRFSTLKIYWMNASSTLYLTQIKLTIEDSQIANGKFIGYISGDELDLLLKVNGGVIPPADPLAANSNCGVIASNPTYTGPCRMVSNATSNCNPMFYGLQVADINAVFTLTAIVTYEGFVETGDEVVPFRHTASVNVIRQ